MSLCFYLCLLFWFCVHSLCSCASVPSILNVFCMALFSVSTTVLLLFLICIYKHFRIHFPSIIKNLVILVGLSFFLNSENNDILWYWGILSKKRSLFNYLSPFLLKYLPNFEDVFSVLVHFNFILARQELVWVDFFMLSCETMLCYLTRINQI